jgi:hypothetical protein
MTAIKPIVFAQPKAQRMKKPEKPARMESTRKKPVPNPRKEIRGMAVGSTYEANVADALDALGWKYWYQYQVAGGRERRGGMVVDFIVWTRPAATPLWVNGRYWHARRGEQDRLQQARLKQLIKFPTRDPLTLWDEDCMTFEDAYSFLLAALGRG